MSHSPRRRRGLTLKTILLACGAIFVLIAVALPIGLAVWSTRERAAVAKRVAAIQAAGEPILPGDFVEASVPDAQNKVLSIRAAIAAQAVDEGRDAKRKELEQADDNAFTMPLTDDEVALLRADVDANAAALSALAQLDGRDGVAWGGPWRSFFQQLGSDDKTLNQVRALANLSCDAAKLAARDGRLEDAIAISRRVEAMADAVAARRTLIDMLVAHGLRAMSADQAHVIARSPHAPGAAARPAVQAWIAALLDDAPIARTTRDGLLGERASLHDVFTSLATGTMPAGAMSSPGIAQMANMKRISGIVWRSDRVTLDGLSESLRIVDAPDRAAWDARAGRLRQITDDARASKLSLLAGILMPSLDRAIAGGYRLRTDRHLAATALAIRLYQLDHGGERPDTLTALVPAYLPAAPIDGESGRPLSYDRERLRIWGVGENGQDDGGVSREDCATQREFAKRGDNVRSIGPATRPAPTVGDAAMDPPGDADAAMRPVVP